MTRSGWEAAMARPAWAWMAMPETWWATVSWSSRAAAPSSAATSPGTGGSPSLAGRYVYGDLCSGEIRSFVPSFKRARRDRATGLRDQPGLASFGEDSRGGLYVVSTGAGKVFAIKPR